MRNIPEEPFLLLTAELLIDPENSLIIKSEGGKHPKDIDKPQYNSMSVGLDQFDHI